MNTPKTSTQFRRILTVILFAALTSSITAVSSAADSTDALRTKVNYADLNISSNSGAIALYSRIRAAAERVCHPLDNRDFASQKLLASCKQGAIREAVNEVGQPALFTVFNAKTGNSKPIMLASGQTR